MKTLFKVLFSALLLLLVVTSALIAFLYFAPEKSVTLAVHWFGPSTYQISWQKLDIDWKLHFPLALQGEIEVHNLKVQGTKNQTLIGVQKIQTRFDFQFQDSKLKLQSLILKSPDPWILDLTIPQADPSPREESASPLEQIRMVKALLSSLHERLQIGLVDSDISKVEVRLTENIWTGKLNVQSPFNSSVVNFSSEWTQKKDEKFQTSIKGSLLLGKDEPYPLQLKTEIDLKIEKIQTKQTLELQSTNEKDELKTRGLILIQAGQNRIQVQPKLELILTGHELRAQLEASARGLPKPIAKADDLKLSLKIPLESQARSQFDLLLPLEIYGPKPRVLKELKTICDCQNPLRFAIEAHGDFNLNQLLAAEEDSSNLLTGELIIRGPTSRLFTLNLKSWLHLERENGKYRFKPELNSSLLIPSFKRLHPLLQAFGIFVPAPLDVMDGQVQLEAQGYLTVDENFYYFPIQLKTDLKSSKQVAQITTDSQVKVRSNFKEVDIDVKAQIKQLRLELPPLNPLGGRPRITPDSRILTEPENPKDPSPLKVTFHFQVASSQPGSIQLLADYFKPHVPITLNLDLESSKSRQGKLRLEPFDIVYLKRKVYVEKMKLDLDQVDKDVIPVEGRLRIKQTNYTIFIEIQGNAFKPNITLRSDPELSENEIISVLLYDRTSEQLVSGDAETAGGVQAALADRAIGLFGLWAFASTPIRSFSYNPATKVYTATLALGDGLTAGIGTTWESTTQLELRKRLSRKWILTASWSTLNPEEGQQTRLVLQWENRF